MEKLPYRFAKKHPLQVEEMHEQTGMNKSMIARAAFQIGMNVLRSGDNDMSVEDMIAIFDAKARN